MDNFEIELDLGAGIIAGAVHSTLLLEQICCEAQTWAVAWYQYKLWDSSLRRYETEGHGSVVIHILCYKVTGVTSHKQ